MRPFSGIDSLFFPAGIQLYKISKHLSLLRFYLLLLIFFFYVLLITLLKFLPVRLVWRMFVWSKKNSKNISDIFIKVCLSVVLFIRQLNVYGVSIYTNSAHQRVIVLVNSAKGRYICINFSAVSDKARAF